jgi:uncharacterized phage-associated protein
MLEMTKALEVAKCLIHLAAAEEEPEQLSHLRVQKLLYYSQGWSLALRSKSIFPDRIEAWVHGPVVPSVYPHFADYGYNPIPHTKVPHPKGVSKADRDFIESVWSAYKGYSANSLREMTHSKPHGKMPAQA